MEEDEEKTDDGEVRELEEGVEIIKLEEEVEEDSVQAEPSDNNDKKDEVQLTPCIWQLVCAVLLVLC